MLGWKIIFVLPLVLPPFAFAQGDFCEQNKANIYTIDARLPGGHPVRLTGFKAKTFPGILTSLHGVVGATDIFATSNDTHQPVLFDLQVAWVDIPNDVAALEPAGTALGAGGLEVNRNDVQPKEALTGCGHPYGNALRNRPTPANATPTKSLNSFTGTDIQAFLDRKSPDPTITVIDLNAQMVPGESGQPIVDADGRVRGIADGGIDRGAAGISWAIPIGKVHLERSSDKRDAISTLLSRGSSTLVFSYDVGHTVNPHEWIVAMDGDKAHSLSRALINAKAGDYFSAAGNLPNRSSGACTLWRRLRIFPFRRHRYDALSDAERHRYA